MRAELRPSQVARGLARGEGSTNRVVGTPFDIGGTGGASTASPRRREGSAARVAPVTLAAGFGDPARATDGATRRCSTPGRLHGRG